MRTEGFLQCSHAASPDQHRAMLYYVVEAVTKDAPVRLRSFDDHEFAIKYANLYMTENPNSFWVGVVDHDEWFHCFA